MGGSACDEACCVVVALCGAEWGALHDAVSAPGARALLCRDPLSTWHTWAATGSPCFRTSHFTRSTLIISVVSSCRLRPDFPDLNQVAMSILSVDSSHLARSPHSRGLAVGDAHCLKRRRMKNPPATTRERGNLSKGARNRGESFHDRLLNEALMNPTSRRTGPPNTADSRPGGTLHRSTRNGKTIPGTGSSSSGRLHPKTK